MIIEKIRFSTTNCTYMTHIIRSKFAVIIRNRFIYNIPAINHARIFFLKMCHYFFDVFLQTIFHHICTHIGTICRISFAEEPVAHIRIPRKHVSTDLQAICPCIFYHFVRCRKINTRSRLFIFIIRLRSGLSQKRISLHLITECRAVKMVFDQFCQFFVTQCLRRNIGSKFESILLCQAG